MAAYRRSSPRSYDDPKIPTITTCLPVGSPIHPNGTRNNRRQFSCTHDNVEMKLVRQWSCDVCRDAFFDSYDDAYSHEVLCRFRQQQALRYQENAYHSVGISGSETMTNSGEQRETIYAARKNQDSTERRDEVESRRRHVRLERRESNRKKSVKWQCDKCKREKFPSYVDAYLHERSCPGVDKPKYNKGGGNMQHNFWGNKHSRKSIGGQEKIMMGHDDESSYEISWTRVKSTKTKKTKCTKQKEDKEEKYFEMTKCDPIDNLPLVTDDAQRKLALRNKLRDARQRWDVHLKKDSVSPPPPLRRKSVSPLKQRTHQRPPLPPQHRRSDIRRKDHILTSPRHVAPLRQVPTTIVMKRKVRAIVCKDADTIKYLCSVCRDICFDDMASASIHEASCTGLAQEPCVYLRDNE